MRINKLDLARLRNDEHFQFNTHFKMLVTKHGPETLKIQDQFEKYQAQYDKEDEGIKKIRKSAITAEMQAADKARDEIWSGMLRICSGALKDFDPDVKKAGQRLKIVFDAYGNVTIKPMNEQTSSISNILQELKSSKYAPDVAAVGIKRWVEELEARNIAFDKLMVDRFDEKTQKSDVVVKEARAALDEAYRAIVDRIHAYVLLEGKATYEQFISSLNTIIAQYADILSRRLGKKKTTDTAAIAGDTAPE